MDNVYVLKSSASIVSGALAFVAGFADAASFVGAGGIFCAHVTGNFVVLAADLARGASANELLKLATFPLFVVSVLAATKLFKARPNSTPRTLLLASGLLLGSAAIAAILPGIDTRLSAGLWRALVVALLVLAMGLQNALHRLHPQLGPMTTVMTGNVTGFLVDLATPGAPENAAKRRTTGLILVAFTLGCAAGAFGVARLGFAALALPCLIVLGVRSLVRVPPSPQPAA